MSSGVCIRILNHLGTNDSKQNDLNQKISDQIMNNEHSMLRLSLNLTEFVLRMHFHLRAAKIR